jgi:hypothetical protein
MNRQRLFAFVAAGALTSPALVLAQGMGSRQPPGTVIWQQRQALQQQQTLQSLYSQPALGQEYLRQLAAQQQQTLQNLYRPQDRLALQNSLLQLQLRDEYLRLTQPGTPWRTGQSTFCLTPQDLELLRAHPDKFGLVYLNYAVALRAYLGDGFTGMTDEGFVAAFACMAAYQLKPYRATGDPCGGPADYSLAGLMAAPKLMCQEYCFLTARLFGTLPPNARPGATFRLIGWDKGSLNDHGQVFVTGVGVPLMLDPTIGLVARADLREVCAGLKVPVPWIRRSTWVRDYSTGYLAGYLGPFMASFGQNVCNVLRLGLYPGNVIDTNDVIVTPGN